MDRTRNLLDSVEQHLEAAHDRIERDGTVADASLLLAVTQLLEAVNAIYSDLESTNKILFHSAQ